eukprot:GFYU01058479.1.p1 GENE.GFYU01058479.1~~GFYU01058479.1.p1  ORF type:complete len:239 (-),score=55.11 GFYU01058479.1:92-733(-)
MEDQEWPVVKATWKRMGLDDALFKRYMRIVFLCTSNMKTQDKRLVGFSFEDFEHCADVFCTVWSEEADPLEIDDAWAEEIRELKLLMFADKEYVESYRSAVVRHCSTVMPGALVSRIESRFVNVVRNILTIGAGLAHEKESRNFLTDLIDRVANEFKKMEMGQDDVDTLFASMRQTLRQVNTIPEIARKRFGPVWTRLLNGMQACLLQIYAKV